MAYFRIVALLPLALLPLAEAFAPVGTPALGLRAKGHFTTPAVSRSRNGVQVSMAEDTAKLGRREVLSAGMFAAVATALSSPAQADMLKAACTYADCPEAPKDAALELELFQVKPSKWTGAGYSYSRPNDTFFKRVTSPSSLRNPGSILFRDKRTPDTALFSDVQEISNQDRTWAPTLVDSYKKQFGDKFKLIKEDGPKKNAGYDLYYAEYVVETELAGKFEKIHFVSSFAATDKNVYIVNAQAKESDWDRVGEALKKTAMSLEPNA